MDDANRRLNTERPARQSTLVVEPALGDFELLGRALS
jgi:hypothetical protein